LSLWQRKEYPSALSFSLLEREVSVKDSIVKDIRKLYLIAFDRGIDEEKAIKGLCKQFKLKPSIVGRIV